jgi:phenylacetate-CoA ligase
MADLKATLKGAKTCLVKRHTGAFKRLYRQISQTQWYTKDQLDAFQLEQLQRLVRHAWETVPYWRRVMDEHGIRPDDIRQLDDIRRFPIMSKDDLQKAGDEILSTRYRRAFLSTAHTGGTTGLPVPVRRDPWSIAREHAFVRRQFDWAGVRTSDRCAYLEGRTVAPPGQRPSSYHYYDAAMRELTLSTFHLTPDMVPHYVDLMKAYRIKALIAYPSAAYVLAKGCLERKLALKLHCVLTTSETLDETKKRTISEAFECPVFDFYGSTERVCYIQMCERGSSHVIPEYGLTELIPAAPPNEDCCQVVSTGFWSLTVPLIRYNLRDLVKVSGRTCSCGRAFTVVDKIIGRDGSMIVTPSGLQLGASAIECILANILYTMYDMPVVAGRVVQDACDLLTLEYVPDAGFASEHTERLRAVMAEHVPTGMRAELRALKEMDRTSRGKFVSFVMAEHH